MTGKAPGGTSRKFGGVQTEVSGRGPRLLRSCLGLEISIRDPSEASFLVASEPAKHLRSPFRSGSMRKLVLGLSQKWPKIDSNLNPFESFLKSKLSHFDSLLGWDLRSRSTLETLVGHWTIRSWVSLRLQLQCFNAGEKPLRFFGPPKCLAPENLVMFSCDGKKAANLCDSVCDFPGNECPHRGLAGDRGVCDRKPRWFAIAISGAIRLGAHPTLNSGVFC